MSTILIASGPRVQTYSVAVFGPEYWSAYLRDFNPSWGAFLGMVWVIAPNGREAKRVAVRLAKCQWMHGFAAVPELARKMGVGIKGDGSTVYRTPEEKSDE